MAAAARALPSRRVSLGERPLESKVPPLNQSKLMQAATSSASAVRYARSLTSLLRLQSFKADFPRFTSALHRIHTRSQLVMASSTSDIATESSGPEQSQQPSPFPFRQFLAQSPYQPPMWARHLAPVPPKRMNLGQFPTPIHKWPLSDLPEGLEVYIKRDDLTGLQLSGNKVRKLEFLIADAKAQGADCVITIGGIQSNHCRATAVAARYAGLDTFLILRTSKTVVDRDPGLVGNLLVERMVGAHIDLVTKEEYVKHGSMALGEQLKRKLQVRQRLNTAHELFQDHMNVQNDIENS